MQCTIITALLYLVHCGSFASFLQHLPLLMQQVLQAIEPWLSNLPSSRSQVHLQPTHTVFTLTSCSVLQGKPPSTVAPQTLLGIFFPLQSSCAAPMNTKIGQEGYHLSSSNVAFPTMITSYPICSWLAKNTYACMGIHHSS